MKPQATERVLLVKGIVVSSTKLVSGLSLLLALSACQNSSPAGAPPADPAAATPSAVTAAGGSACPTPSADLVRQQQAFAYEWRVVPNDRMNERGVRDWVVQFNQLHACGQFQDYQAGFIKAYDYATVCMHMDRDSARDYAIHQCSQYRSDQVADEQSCVNLDPSDDERGPRGEGRNGPAEPRNPRVPYGPRGPVLGPIQR